MKSSFGVLLVSLLPFAMGFTPSSNGRSGSELFNKKYPQGRPNTDQVDEDLAMWFEDKQGNRKKALSKPVGGRPINLYSKQQVEEIEKRGIDPLEKPKRFLEWALRRPTRGY